MVLPKYQLKINVKQPVYGKKTELKMMCQSETLSK